MEDDHNPFDFPDFAIPEREPDPFREGFHAAIRGAWLADCPHPDRSADAREWRSGWDTAHEQRPHGWEEKREQFDPDPEAVVFRTPGLAVSWAEYECPRSRRRVKLEIRHQGGEVYEVTVSDRDGRHASTLRHRSLADAEYVGRQRVDAHFEGLRRDAAAPVL